MEQRENLGIVVVEMLDGKQRRRNDQEVTEERIFDSCLRQLVEPEGCYQCGLSSSLKNAKAVITTLDGLTEQLERPSLSRR